VLPESRLTTQDTTTRLGGWLFRHRTSLPLPAAIAILTLRIGEAPPSALLVGAGVAVTALGELIRLWGVHHIGAISRTRSERLGPLVASGPFARLRNPLYLGNIALWVGFALTARLVWLAPVILVLLALEYHAIVRWEETLLESRLGQAYRDYAARVPRWIPLFYRGDRRDERRDEDLFEKDLSASFVSSAVKQQAFSWRATLFSERGTFIAIALGYLVLWLKLKT
jgi:protein-S-isoprenylcysteine O-methyltransferase Ste14